MEVIFQPRCKPREGEPVSLAQCLKMTVLHNPFDAAVFRLSGTCISHDVVFEDLPGASGVDELTFEQVRARTKSLADVRPRLCFHATEESVAP